jgi:dihydroorotate dehydrogenase (NAD+) catalytic subunit
MRPTLEVDLAGLRLRSPVVAAAGCFGTGREHAGLVDASRLGAVVSRSITLGPRAGSPPPRVAETPSGILWSVGLQNPGAAAFVEEELPRLARAAPVLVSVAGGSLEEYVAVAARVHTAPGVVGLEVALDLPDEELDRPSFCARPDRAAEVAGAVARLAHVPVFAKLPGFLPTLEETARACVRAGVHGLSVGGGLPGMAVDPAGPRPALGAVTGWVSGPAVRPVAVRAAFELARALPEVPLMVGGGVRTGEEAVELMLAGAWAVQVGTAILVDPDAPARVADGISAHLAAAGLRAPGDLRGRLALPRPEGPG